MYISVITDFKMKTQRAGKSLTLDSILEMTVNELGMHLRNREQDTTAVTKPERQKRLIKLLSGNTTPEREEQSMLEYTVFDWRCTA